ncbi:hypothetical protein DFS34DRAFT_599422 [Phlyctochytrium arcticum]|nr:hypothetical protein DFS34DRAFT_599422 [Phlyctochytrium arcticum]
MSKLQSNPAAPPAAVVIQPNKKAAKKLVNEEPQFWWVNAIFVLVVHLLSVYAIFFVPATAKTLWLAFALHTGATLGITLGYHRLFSHRSYRAHWAVRVIYGFLGSIAFQGSIRWWVLRHRLHHQFTDTDQDPYAAKNGFFFSHIGWIFQLREYRDMNKVDKTDLNEDWVVRWQHKLYVPMSFFNCYFLPAIVAHYGWNDGFAAMFWCGFVARVTIWHVTFSINSFAHWIGDQEFASTVSARGGLILAIFTHGEGYHNFHHEFPMDYRNGHNKFDWDPTKWIIYGLSKIGLTSHLNKTPEDCILKARVAVLESLISPPTERLPLKPMTRGEVKAAVQKQGKEWIIIEDFVHDVSEFKSKHPGGEGWLRKWYGLDATKMFNGGACLHTASARRLTEDYRIGFIQEVAAETKED